MQEEEKFEKVEKEFEKAEATFEEERAELNDIIKAEAKLTGQEGKATKAKR